MIMQYDIFLLFLFLLRKRIWKNWKEKITREIIWVPEEVMEDGGRETGERIGEGDFCRRRTQRMTVPETAMAVANTIPWDDRIEDIFFLWIYLYVYMNELRNIFVGVREKSKGDFWMEWDGEKKWRVSLLNVEDDVLHLQRRRVPNPRDALSLSFVSKNYIKLLAFLFL